MIKYKQYLEKETVKEKKQWENNFNSQIQAPNSHQIQ